MMLNDLEMITQARQAFISGDLVHGGKIVHGVLKSDIHHAEAWSLLYTYLGRGKPFDEFQEFFVRKYYPEKYHEFLARRAMFTSSPYRRVSIVPAPPEDQEEAENYGLLKFPRPKTGPAPKARKIAPSDAKKAVVNLPRIFKRKIDFPRKKNSRKKLKKARKKNGEANQRSLSFGRLKSLFTNRKAETSEELTKQKPRTPLEKVLPLEKASPAMVMSEKVIETPRKIMPGRETPKKSVKKVVDGPADVERVRVDKNGKTDTGPLLSKLDERDEIRIVIADDIQKTRENIRKLLLFESNIEVVGVAASGQEALDVAIDTQPDIVLLDINMPDMDGLQALKLIRSELPTTQVIMLTVQDDPGYLREALQLGARDYLIKPPMIDDLLATIQKASEIARAERERFERLSKPPASPLEELTDRPEGRTVAVFSPKGGVGCSVLAANMAVALGLQGESVILVDCNLQYGGVGLLFNTAVRTSIADLAPFVDELEAEVIEAASILHEDSGVRLLLAPNGLGKGENVTGEQISALLKILKKYYTYVLVDTSSIMNDLTVSALENSDHVILVTTQDIPSINDIRRCLNLAPGIGIDPQRISLVLNQYHTRVNITPEKISKNLGKEISAVIPLDSPTVLPSINRGIPFMSSTANGKSRNIARAVSDLVEHVLSFEEALALD